MIKSLTTQAHKIQMTKIQTTKSLTIRNQMTNQ